MEPQRERAIRACCFDRIAKHTGIGADAPIRWSSHADAFGSDLSNIGITSNNHSPEPLDHPAPSQNSQRESSAGSDIPSQRISGRQAETTQNLSRKRYVNASVFIVRFHSRLTSARSRMESQKDIPRPPLQHRSKRSRAHKNVIPDDESEDDPLSTILEDNRQDDVQDPSTEEEDSNTD